VNTIRRIILLTPFCQWLLKNTKQLNDCGIVAIKRSPANNVALEQAVASYEKNAESEPFEQKMAPTLGSEPNVAGECKPSLAFLLTQTLPP
jgi:hypothetical protein